MARDQGSPAKRVVVGTDGSGTAQQAVDEAAALARALGAELHLVTAYSPRQLSERIASSARSERVDLARVAEEELLRTAAALRQDDFVIDVHARGGDPAEVLIDVARELKADLIVVGSKGMSGVERFLLGGVANKVSHHAPCNVLIVRTG